MKMSVEISPGRDEARNRTGRGRHDVAVDGEGHVDQVSTWPSADHDRASEHPALEPSSATIAYPFSALHGQSCLQSALLLVAVDPRIGGVLIQGVRGTAKSTSARALSDILPKGAFVNLPLGASEEQLAGSLNLDVVLQQGRSVFRPGLLAKAHQGVLYVDEVNLLADNLVDLLLDVCGSGINRVERDGLSHQHAARIVLVGTMNPEEGELRPQLLDRFGLFVEMDDVIDVKLRQAIVRSRLSFDDDPVGFVERFSAEQQRLKQQLLHAREQLPNIHFTDKVHERIARLCHEAQVDGVRADLVMLRASRAMAALQGRSAIQSSDIDAVAELVLSHRRQTADTSCKTAAGTVRQQASGGSHNAAGGTAWSNPSAQSGQSDSHLACKNLPEQAATGAVAKRSQRRGQTSNESLDKDKGHSRTGSSVSAVQDTMDSDAMEVAVQHAGADAGMSAKFSQEDAHWGAMSCPAPVLAVHPLHVPGGPPAKKP